MQTAPHADGSAELTHEPHVGFPFGPGMGDSVSVAALVVTTSERAAAAVLTARSIARHHPDLPLTVVVVDDRFGEVARSSAAEPGTWVPASRIVGIDALLNIVAEHHLADACTIIEPTIVAAMLSAGAAGSTGFAVMVVADHLILRKPITEFLDSSLPTNGGFVPVRRSPVPIDGRLPDAADLAAYGHFHRDLAVFTTAGRHLVDVWAASVRHQPLEGDGRFDRIHHPWFDELVLRAPHEVHLADQSLVASFRNLDERSVLHEAAAFSFEGFDPDRPWALSALTGEWPRVMISAHIDLRQLVETRVDSMRATESLMPRMVNPYDTRPNGHEYDDAMRLLFTQSLHHSLRHGGAPPPNPYQGFDAFVAFLAEPAPERPGISRHLHAWSVIRPDLGTTFRHDDGAFNRWAITDAIESGIWIASTGSEMVDDATIDSRYPLSPDANQRTAYGVNVVGLLSAQLGIGEQGRLALRAIAQSSIPYSVIDHDDTIHKRESSVLVGHPELGFHYDVDILLLNADQTRTALDRLGRNGQSAPLGRPTVGLWAWESPVFPERFHSAYELVSEVWVASRYIQETLVPSATAAGVGVHVLPLQFPYVVDRTRSPNSTTALASIGVDANRPYFTFMFDYFSVAERKQPWAAIDAFRRAFPPTRNDCQGGPQFVVKSLNHEFFPLERERLLRAIAGRTDIVLIERYLSPSDRTTLIACAAGYVSLHRAEGLGLTMAEAMGAGTPVVATGWSGNLEFTTPSNSWLVGYDLVDIPVTVAHYGGAGQWAEPSIDEAAQHMRTIIEDPASASVRAHQAVQDLIARNATGADASFVVERVRQLRSSAPNRPPLPAASPTPTTATPTTASASHVPGGAS